MYICTGTTDTISPVLREDVGFSVLCCSCLQGGGLAKSEVDVVEKANTAK